MPYRYAFYLDTSLIPVRNQHIILLIIRHNAELSFFPGCTEDDLPFIEVGPYCDYLVDLENTGNDWDVIITRLKSKDRVFFFSPAGQQAYFVPSFSFSRAHQTLPKSQVIPLVC